MPEIIATILAIFEKVNVILRGCMQISFENMVIKLTLTVLSIGRFRSRDVYVSVYITKNSQFSVPPSFNCIKTWSNFEW